MNLEISKELLEDYFSKARDSFKRIIEKEDANESFEKFPPIDPKDMIVDNGTVGFKLSVHGFACDVYFIDIVLELISPDGKKIGYYKYVLNNEGEIVDDFLLPYRWG